MTQQIRAYTLVDITNTGIVRVRDNNKKEYHQQQNLNVLLQTIGLRTQPLEPEVSLVKNVDLSEYNFSDQFQGKGNVWVLTFYIDRESPWNDGQDELALLNQDANKIAITSDLDNSFDFPINVFDTKDNINLYFIIN